MVRAMLSAVLGIGAVLAAPQPAQAYWTRWGWRAPVVVVPPPVLAYGPPPYGLAPRPVVWVRPHYDPWGHFIPGHWR